MWIILFSKPFSGLREIQMPVKRRHKWLNAVIIFASKHFYIMSREIHLKRQKLAQVGVCTCDKLQVCFQYKEPQGLDTV